MAKLLDPRLRGRDKGAQRRLFDVSSLNAAYKHNNVFPVKARIHLKQRIIARQLDPRFRGEDNGNTRGLSMEQSVETSTEKILGTTTEES